jgi:cytochrome c oxidase subunit 2
LCHLGEARVHPSDKVFPVPAPHRRRQGRTLLRILGLVVLVALGTTGCNGQASRIGWPSPVTKEGRNVLNVWYGSFTTACIVGGFVILLILWSALWYRARSKDQLPRQVRYNLPIEVLYTLIPVVIVGVLFYFTAIRENDYSKFDTKPAMSIGVTGFQWSWQFNYLDSGVSVTGRPGEPPQLVIPTGVPIRFYETSADVQHAFWVIPFLFKRDIYPGRVNSFQTTVTKAGLFRGKCTEFCGLNHDRMLFSVKAVPMSEYQQWLGQTKSVAAAGNDPRYAVYTGPKIPTEPAHGTNQRSHQ